MDEKDEKDEAVGEAHAEPDADALEDAELTEVSGGMNKYIAPRPRP